MIISFGDETTEDIFNGTNSRAARAIATDVWKGAAHKLDMINAADDMNDLLLSPSNNFEMLKGKYQGLCSIRVDDQFNIIFRWLDNWAQEVTITSYHQELR